MFFSHSFFKMSNRILVVSGLSLGILCAPAAALRLAPGSQTGTQAAAQQFSTGGAYANSYYGRWRTEAKDEESKTAVVELGPCAANEQHLCGKIIDIEEPLDPATGQPKLDKENNDKSLRQRPIIGLEMVWGLKPTQKGGYDGGQIYSPKTGKTYRASMKLVDQHTLNVTGHVLFFTKTQTWRREN